MAKNLETKKIEITFAMPEEEDKNRQLLHLLDNLEKKDYNIISFAPCRALSELTELPRLVTSDGYVVTGIENTSFYLNKIS